MEDYIGGFGEVKLPYGAFFTLTNKLYGALAIEIMAILHECNDLIPDECADAFDEALGEIAKATEKFADTHEIWPNYYTHETGVLIACMMSLGEVAKGILRYIPVTMETDTTETLNRMVSVGKEWLIKLAEGGE